MRIITAQAVHNSRRRLEEIDILRGLAVILMVGSHGMHWFYEGKAHEIVTVLGYLSPGDLAAALFFISAGMSLRLSLQKRAAQEDDGQKLARGYVEKFGHLFLVGVALSLFWGVLQAQAVALTLIVLLYLGLRRLQWHDKELPWLVLTGALAAAHFGLYWGADLHKGSSYLFFSQFPPAGILILALIGFRIVPWLRSPRFVPGALAIGVLMSLPIGWLLMEGYPITRSGLGPAFMISGLALVSLLLPILRGLHKVMPDYVRPLALVGRDALYLFVFHYIAFGLPLHVLGVAGQFDAGPALLLASTMTMLVLMVAWKRDGHPDGYAWTRQVFLSVVGTVRMLLSIDPTAWSERTSRLRATQQEFLPSNYW